MGARKRATPEAATKPPPPTAAAAAAATTSSTTEPPIAPPKAGQILTTSLIFFVPYAYLIFSHYNIEPDLKRSILINAILSSVAFLVTLSMIPVASRYVLRRNLFGYDINKKGTPQGSVKVPESLGIVVGIVFLVFAILFQHFNFTSDSINRKLVLPSIAALPLLMAYAGHTTIVIPKPLVPYLGLEILDLGWIYKLYMWLLAIFCTNSINIHAGINGLEVGQTIVISCAILVHNVMQIGVSSDPEYKQAHAFSIYLVQPLLATSMALFSYNWYPSSVFVGDTYTYFAGMTMAVAGILGHFSETLLIFFIPQVLNFLLSLPQLSGYIPCPRHRLPRFDPQTGLLTGTNDGTLVNLFLRQFGRKSENSLCILLLVFQAICCCFCFLLRWFLAGWYK
ncbi:uncharacterized protein LOC131322676 isoform X2 [Rhododendron vialii]|uniref:uncharacterized protein LOC131322676 isoform X2 n=1 Tax=Rhododendron vialii TaxID=182163 RepID=UPI0026602CD7|nr:uncharacterized protein LOC131322676 isoform X2 [Rhododendron vialii]